MGFAARKVQQLGWMLIGTGWASTLFYWMSLWAPNRAISIADNQWGAANWASVIGMVPAFVFAFVMLYVSYCFARQALRSAD